MDLDNKSNIYTAYFSDASSLRAVVDFLKSTVGHGNFIFKKKTINFRQQNETQSLLVDIIIDTNMIGGYNFNLNETDEDVFGTDFVKMRVFTNAIGTKDSFKIWKNRTEPKLFMQKISSKKNLSSVTVEYITHINNTSDKKIKLDEDYKDHVCSILAQEFSEMCKMMVAMKSTHVIATGYSKGIVFESISGSQFTGKKQKFGEFEIPELDNKKSSDVKEIIKVKIKINMIKSLARINSFVASSKGLIRIFVKEKSPICIKSKIGGYGDMTIFIRDEKTNSKDSRID